MGQMMNNDSVYKEMTLMHGMSRNVQSTEEFDHLAWCIMEYKYEHQS